MYSSLQSLSRHVATTGCVSSASQLYPGWDTDSQSEGGWAGIGRIQSVGGGLGWDRKDTVSRRGVGLG